MTAFVSSISLLESFESVTYVCVEEVFLLIELYCQAQPKPKPNHSWAVLVLNPTSPTVHPFTRPPVQPAVRKSMKLVLLSQACKTKVISLYE